MNPAELQLFKRKVGEFENVVDHLVASPPNLHARLQEEISILQQWFKERPWVSHFVPHLNVVRGRLNDFETSLLHASQPAPQSIRLGVMNLQPTSPVADQEKTEYVDLFSYFRSRVKLPVYLDPVHVKEPYYGYSPSSGRSP